MQTKQKGHFQNQISRNSQGEGNGSNGGGGITGKPRGGWTARGGEGRDEEKRHKEDLKKPRHPTHSSLYSKHVGGISAFGANVRICRLVINKNVFMYARVGPVKLTLVVSHNVHLT